MWLCMQDLELELSEEHAKRMLLELHGQEQLEVEQVCCICSHVLNRVAKTHVAHMHIGSLG